MVFVAELHEINGESHTLSEWAEICGVKLKTVRTRIVRGQTILNAL